MAIPIVKDKTVVRQSYLYDGNPYTGKTTFYDFILIRPPDCNIEAGI